MDDPKHHLEPEGEAWPGKRVLIWTDHPGLPREGNPRQELSLVLGLGPLPSRARRPNARSVGAHGTGEKNTVPAAAAGGVWRGSGGKYRLLIIY